MKNECRFEMMDEEKEGDVVAKSSPSQMRPIHEHSFAIRPHHRPVSGR